MTSDRNRPALESVSQSIDTYCMTDAILPSRSLSANQGVNGRFVPSNCFAKVLSTNANVRSGIRTLTAASTANTNIQKTYKDQIETLKNDNEYGEKRYASVGAGCWISTTSAAAVAASLAS
jgi:hypothetical protein